MILWHVVAFWGVMAMPNRFFSLVAKCLVAFSLVIGPSQALAFSTAKHQLPTTIEGKGDFPTTYVVAPDSDGRGSALYRVDHATASLLASFPDFDFNVAHSDAIVSHDQKNVAVIVSDGPHSALYRVSADGQYITSIYAGGKLDLLASESTKPVPVVTSAAWSPSGDLLYTLVTWPDDEAATVAEKAGKPLPFVGDVWLFESATGQQKRIAQGSYYRVLGLDSEGSKLAVTTLVPFVEDWRSENIAVVDLKAPAAQPVWITEKVGTPDYFAIESVPLADGSLLVSTVFASAMPGTTTFSLDSQALVIDPFTGSTGELAVASNAQASGGDKSLLSTWVDVNPHDFTSSSDQTSGVVYQSGPGIFLLEKGSSQAVLSLSTPDNQGKLVVHHGR